MDIYIYILKTKDPSYSLILILFGFVTKPGKLKKATETCSFPTMAKWVPHTALKNLTLDLTCFTSSAII